MQQSLNLQTDVKYWRIMMLKRQGIDPKRDETFSRDWYLAIAGITRCGSVILTAGICSIRVHGRLRCASLRA